MSSSKWRKKQIVVESGRETIKPMANQIKIVGAGIWEMSSTCKGCLHKLPYQNYSHTFLPQFLNVGINTTSTSLPTWVTITRITDATGHHDTQTNNKKHPLQPAHCNRRRSQKIIIRTWWLKLSNGEVRHYRWKVDKSPSKETDN